MTNIFSCLVLGERSLMDFQYIPSQFQLPQSLSGMRLEKI